MFFKLFFFSPGFKKIILFIGQTLEVKWSSYFSFSMCIKFTNKNQKNNFVSFLIDFFQNMLALQLNWRYLLVCLKCHFYKLSFFTSNENDKFNKTWMFSFTVFFFKPHAFSLNLKVHKYQYNIFKFSMIKLHCRYRIP